MNGIILINKEKEKTSRDVVNEVGRLLHTKKIGHTGTLDPIATGVLVLCLGEATKLCELLTSEYKEYIGTIKLGFQTDTLDITGNVIETKEYHVNEEQISQVLSSFLGESIQETPLYSAVKVNGKKLYEYARSGQHVELPKRTINVKNIKLLSFKDDTITFQATVSKGTYIRALIKDICLKLNTVGTMQDLIRTKQGNFSIEDTFTIQDIQNNNYKLLPISEILNNYETQNISRELYSKIKNGAIIPKTFQNDICVFKYQNEVIAIYQTYHQDSTLAKPYKMFITSRKDN